MSALLPMNPPVRLDKTFREIITYYYVIYPPNTEVTTEMIENRIIQLTKFCNNNFVNFQNHIPELTPVEFIVSIIYFYSTITGKQNENPNNTKELCLFVFGLDTTDNSIIENPIFIKFHKNVIKCLGLLSQLYNPNANIYFQSIFKK